MKLKNGTLKMTLMLFCSTLFVACGDEKNVVSEIITPTCTLPSSCEENNVSPLPEEESQTDESSTSEENTSPPETEPDVAPLVFSELVSFNGNLYASGPFKWNGAQWIPILQNGEPETAIIQMKVIGLELYFITKKSGIFKYDEIDDSAVPVGVGLEGKAIADITFFENRLTVAVDKEGIFQYDDTSFQWTETIPAPFGKELLYSEIAEYSSDLYVGTRENPGEEPRAQGLLQYTSGAWIALSPVSSGSAHTLPVGSADAIDALIATDIGLFVTAHDPSRLQSALFFEVHGRTMTKKPGPGDADVFTDIIVLDPDTLYVSASNNHIWKQEFDGSWTQITLMRPYTNARAMAFHNFDLYVGAEEVTSQNTNFEFLMFQLTGSNWLSLDQ
ncbi:MAG: hypothetical protein A3I05_03100 [Deltaproteobacteria bacterium RIFCSPLOWO2_02_FULL_44_10]|nr:MAG: hypothetical protein A3C46_09020 [Deltaproteobacteria bacterium RIFCSPHIGHO2_02_FULL_44_16]OGQ46868.1 MAG: hypothetical protein A3I05_03100 [Deltaproteobacteria bacterium RIFCSPLOWO2_02_FULL_44_10]